MAAEPLPHFSTAAEYVAAGKRLVEQERYEDALATFRLAADLEPRNPDWHYNMATVQRFLGLLAAAEQSCSTALRFRPGDADALYLRSDLRDQTGSDNHIPELLRACETESNPQALSSICYALAKEYEDIGDYSNAFAAMKRAGDIRRANMRYDIAHDEQILSAIASTFDTAFLHREVVNQSDADPVFIVGLPRTGSTLLERILCASGSIRSAGELAAFGAAVSTLAAKIDTLPARSALDVVIRSARIDMGELGHTYLRLADAGRLGAGRFIDKLLLNFLYLGLIRRSLPHARLIHIHRRPLDTALAIYKQRFVSAYPYSYNLDDLGRYLIAYHRLMAHWRRTLPGEFLEVSYESLVASPAATARRVSEYCGLGWDETSLEAVAPGYVVTTASASQARHPIHGRSVERWKCYEPQLQPLRERLRAAGITSFANE
jgi:tetratricopeptide (TPR) repeat protein